MESGFLVDTASNRRSAEKLARSGRHDAVILGHTLDKSDRNRVAGMIKRANPLACVIMTYEGSISEAEMADAVLSVQAPVCDIVQTLRHLSERGRRRA
jgi:DNA-binding NtrC family response regulator